MKRLKLGKVALFICDVQDRFRPLIYRSESIINRCKLLNEGARLLNVPCVVTEQYVKAFGKTVPEIKLNWEGGQGEQGDYVTPCYEKKKFSMMTDELLQGFGNQLSNQGGPCTDVILCGIEAHVCVLQTALDLLKSNINVHLVCDAVSSQRPHDRAVALHRMKEAGVILTTAESALFELAESADHPNFKQLSSLVKASNEGVNEFAHDVTI